jgi:hypothetical protein
MHITPTPSHRISVSFLQIFIEFSGMAARKPRYFAGQTAVSN